MRERAEKATPGPWHGDDAYPHGEAIVWAGQATVAEVSMPIPPEFGLDGRADREHIASWHPAVALAVADWLEAEATASEAMALFTGVAASIEHEVNIRGAAMTIQKAADGAIQLQADTSGPAIAVARVYLGVSS